MMKTETFTVQYAVLEIREIQIPASTQEEAESLVQSQKGLYATDNPLHTTDRWLKSWFYGVLERKRYEDD
jgi:hypothetical protein